jgi:hypothetical protein
VALLPFLKEQGEEMVEEVDNNAEVRKPSREPALMLQGLLLTDSDMSTFRIFWLRLQP